jgi:peptidyl-prolyl cis-trans isomerase SurA
MCFTKKLCTLLASVLLIGFATAQTKKVLADKIIAQVGDRIILRSDVVNALADMKRQAQQQNQENIQLPTECQILEGQMTQKALYLGY